MIIKEPHIDLSLTKKLKELEKTLQLTQSKLTQVVSRNEELEGILQGVAPAKKSKIITIKSATKIEFVTVDDIVCCNADEAYTDIQLVNGRTITAAKPLSTFDNLLMGYSFFRISKSHLINIDHVITFHKDKNQILMEGNILLDVARRRRIDFLKTL